MRSVKNRCCCEPPYAALTAGSAMLAALGFAMARTAGPTLVRTLGDLNAARNRVEFWQALCICGLVTTTIFGWNQYRETLRRRCAREQSALGAAVPGRRAIRPLEFWLYLLATSMFALATACCAMIFLSPDGGTSYTAADRIRVEQDLPRAGLYFLLGVPTTCIAYRGLRRTAKRRIHVG